MQKKVAVLLLLGIGLTGTLAARALLESRIALTRSPDLTQPLVPIKVVLVPNGETSPLAKLSPHGHPIQIVRRAKFPDDLEFTGAALVKTEEEFLSLVGSKNRRYLRWNNVNFSRQSLCVFAKKYFSMPPVMKIRSVERAGDKMIFNVIEDWDGNGPRPAVVRIGWDAVVVQKSETANQIDVQIVSE